MAPRGRRSCRGRTVAAILGAAGLWLAACSEPGTGPEPDPEPDPSPPAPNRPPAATGPIPDREVALRDTIRIGLGSYFRDPDGDALTWRAVSSNPAVASTAVAGNVVTVTALGRGTATITVAAADPDGLEASLDFEVTVPNSGPEPAGDLPALELDLWSDTAVNVAPAFTDPDGDTLIFRAASSDLAVTLADAEGGVVTVTALGRGTATITVTASDPHGLDASLDFEVTVPNSPPRPTVPIPDIELASGAEATVDAASHFTDPDGDTLTYASESSDPAAVRAITSGSVVTVQVLSRGSATVTVTATDAAGLSGSLSFEVSVPNRAPRLTAALSDLTLTAGEELRLNLSLHFSDPDGDPMAFSASSSDETRVSLAASGDTVRIRAERAGSARVTVHATDSPGLATQASFDVTVRRADSPPRPGFNIDIAWHASVPLSARATIEQAVSVWESILADTELPDISVNARRTCFGYTTTDTIDVIDDLLILFAADYIDGPRKTLGRAGPCAVRSKSGFPVVGRVLLDLDDVTRIPAVGLRNVILHEVAHVLGFGTLWDVTNPSSGTADSVAVDTHFPGANAVAAFNAAGGKSYTGGKVPVANENPGRDQHWRDSMFSGELMAPRISVRRSAALSAITIRALADLGYAVSTASADAFTVALPDRPPGPPHPAAAGPMLPVGDDILRIEIRVVDENGRVVRVIPPR